MNSYSLLPSYLTCGERKGERQRMEGRTQGRYMDPTADKKLSSMACHDAMPINTASATVGKRVGHTPHQA